MASKLTDEDVAEVLRLYREGRRVREIAARFGVACPSLYRHLWRAGVTLRTQSAREAPRYSHNSLQYHLLQERHSRAVEAALCKLTPGLRKYLDEDDARRAKRGGKLTK